MSFPVPTIRVAVDLTNPGQFFGCCGLLELAGRISPASEAWFTDSTFHLASPDAIDLSAILRGLTTTVICSDDLSIDDSACPIRIGAPFDLRVDWWRDEVCVGASLKTWSGRQKVSDMARASKEALAAMTATSDVLDFVGAMTIEKGGKRKTVRESVEPFCFDPRRGTSALRDGFSADALSMEVAAYPAVEFLAMVGLQRCRPLQADRRRTFRYGAWSIPTAPSVASAAACGAIDCPMAGAFQFDLGFRDAARRYKYFNFASKLETL